MISNLTKSELNILCIANGDFRDIPEKLKQFVPINSIHLISDQSPNFKVDAFWHYRDCTFGLYEDTCDYTSIPLDTNILTELLACETQALKMMERYEYFNGLYSYDSRINLYHLQLRYWLNYLIKNRVTCCIFMVNPHVIFDYIIYCLCKYLGIRTILHYRTTILIGGNVSIYQYEDMKEQHPEIEERYAFHLQNPQDTDLTDRLLSYYQLRENVSGKTFVGFKAHRWVKLLNLKKLISFLTYRFSHFVEWKQHTTIFDLAMRFSVLIWGSKPRVPKIEKSPNLNIQYVYMALHYQPECSTSPMGGYFVHQDLMIDLLVAALPDTVRLYVKPHKRGGLANRLANRLRHCDQVVIVDPEVLSFELIKSSIAVATVTGTTGWEAFLNNKPVIMFGNYFYQHAPCVFPVQNLQDVEEAIKKIINGDANISDEMIEAFLKAVGDCSFEGWVDNRYEHLSNLSMIENINSITANIANKIYAYR